MAETLVVPYNQVPELGPDVACVIVEPVAANMGLVAPVPGFLSGLREACDRAGALLIFDEVITGFRLSYGGATEAFGVRPDLWCFGKVIGGGLPLAAFGGRRDVMEQLIHDFAVLTVTRYQPLGVNRDSAGFPLQRVGFPCLSLAQQAPCLGGGQQARKRLFVPALG